MADFALVGAAEVATQVSPAEAAVFLGCKDQNDVDVEACVLATFTTDLSAGTSVSWCLPYNTGESLVELRDDQNQLYIAATSLGEVSYFSAVSETGVAVHVDKRNLPPEVLLRFRLKNVACQ